LLDGLNHVMRFQKKSKKAPLMPHLKKRLKSTLQSWIFKCRKSPLLREKRRTPKPSFPFVTRNHCILDRPNRRRTGSAISALGMTIRPSNGVSNHPSIPGRSPSLGNGRKRPPNTTLTEVKTPRHPRSGREKTQPFLSKVLTMPKE
jgi:hypothetical protein